VERVPLNNGKGFGFSEPYTGLEPEPKKSSYRGRFASTLSPIEPAGRKKPVPSTKENMTVEIE